VKQQLTDAYRRSRNLQKYAAAIFARVGIHRADIVLKWHGGDVFAVRVSPDSFTRPLGDYAEMLGALRIRFRRLLTGTIQYGSISIAVADGRIKRLEWTHLYRPGDRLDALANHLFLAGKLRADSERGSDAEQLNALFRPTGE